MSVGSETGEAMKITCPVPLSDFHSGISAIAHRIQSPRDGTCRTIKTGTIKTGWTIKTRLDSPGRLRSHRGR